MSPLFEGVKFLPDVAQEATQLPLLFKGLWVSILMIVSNATP